MRSPWYLNELPSLVLQRPLQLFGKSTEVKISNGIIPTPEMMLWVVTGMSVHQLIEICSPHSKPLLSAMEREVKGDHRASPTMVKLIRRIFESGDLVHLPAKASLTEILEALPHGPIWETLRLSLTQHQDTDFYAMLSRLADIELKWIAAQELWKSGVETDAFAMIEETLGNPEVQWAQHHISGQVALFLEILLQVLVTGERFSEQQTNSSPHPGERKSKVLALLKTGRKPMGHWLVKQQQAVSKTSMPGLSDVLMDKGRDVDDQRLKEWSRGRNLMPLKEARLILESLGDHVTVTEEMSRYRMARFLSFACDVCLAGIATKAPTWKDAQSMVEGRYRELYELAAP